MRKKEPWELVNPYGEIVPPLETVDEFVRGISCNDSSQINRCLWQARQDVPLFQKVLVELAKIAKPPDASRAAFHSAWTGQGLWVRDCFSIDPFLAPALANLLPGYDGPPLRLFRGERWSKHKNGTYGFSWTTSRKAAEMFASGLNCVEDDGGVLLATTASSKAILAEPMTTAGNLVSTNTWSIADFLKK